MALNKFDEIKLHKTILNDRSISREKERAPNCLSHLDAKQGTTKRRINNISISPSPHKHSTRSTSIKKKDISSLSYSKLNDNLSSQKPKMIQKDFSSIMIDRSYTSQFSNKKMIQKTLISHHKREISQSSIKVNSSQKDKGLRYNHANIISVQKTITKSGSNDYMLSSPSEKKIYSAYNSNNIPIKSAKYISSTISSIQTDRQTIPTSNVRSSSLKEAAFFSARKGQHNSAASSSKSPHHSKNSFTQIKIYLLSNWGNTEFIGIKEIFLQDVNQKRIQVIKCKVINGSQSNIYNLFNVNSSYSSMRKSAMWISPFNASDFKCVILEVYFISANVLKAITLSNYSGKDKTIGVKDIEILNESGVVLFKSQIPQAKDGISKSIQIDLTDAFNKEDGRCSIKKIVVNRKAYPNNSSGQMTKEYPLIKSAANFSIVNIKSLEDFPTNDIEANGNDNDAEDKVMIKSKTITAITPLYEADVTYSSDEKAVECQRMRITLLANHGHQKHIGLTNLMMLNDKNEPIDIHTQAKEVIAVPKDIATYLNMKMDKRKFDNIFNNIVQTVDDRFMWLTKMNEGDTHTFIDIVFNQKIRLSKIVFANFNSPKHLDKGVRKGQLQLFNHPDDNQPQAELFFYLHKGIGYENVDYSQELSFPFKEPFLSEEEQLPLSQAKNVISIPEQQYYTPYLPSGFVLRFQLMSNYGNETLIGLKCIELYDQLGRDILKRAHYSLGCYPTRDQTQKQIVLPYLNVKLKDGESNEASAIVYIFNTPISLSYIKLHNAFIEDSSSMGVKEIMVFIDDFIIFEGTLACSENKEGQKETAIVFTGDMDILKHVNNDSLTKSKHYEE